MSKPASTLATTERGVTRSIYKVAVGDYIWHSGAFRRVTAISEYPMRALRMGRFVLHSTCTTVEGAPA